MAPPPPIEAGRQQVVEKDRAPRHRREHVARKGRPEWRALPSRAERRSGRWGLFRRRHILRPRGARSPGSPCGRQRPGVNYTCAPTAENDAPGGPYKPRSRPDPYPHSTPNLGLLGVLDPSPAIRHDGAPAAAQRPPHALSTSVLLLAWAAAGDRWLGPVISRMTA